MMDKNQSEVERSFGSLQTKACAQRPRVMEKSILEEETLRVFKHQNHIFETIFDANENQELNERKPRVKLRDRFILQMYLNLET